MSITIKRPERDVNLCLDLSIQADWEAADRELQKHRKRGSEKMVDDRGTELVQQVRDLEAQMHAASVTFRLRALPRNVWAQHVAENPLGDKPTEEDKRFGADSASFFADILPLSIVSVTDADGEKVEFDPATEFDPLIEQMTDAQYNQFANAAFILNRGSVDVPFSRAASAIPLDSDEK
ncbi:MAG: hypothetical protein ACTHW7_09840 [Actinomycetaceae bacterium]